MKRKEDGDSHLVWFVYCNCIREVNLKGSERTGSKYSQDSVFYKLLDECSCTYHIIEDCHYIDFFMNCAFEQNRFSCAADEQYGGNEVLLSPFTSQRILTSECF
jgi:hypothetical protein